MIKELIKDYGKDETIKIISTENAKSTLCFYSVLGEEYLKNKGLPFEKTPYENVFMLNNFVRDEGFDKGLYTFQALGSVAICDVVESGDTLLDCCSAPGGKSIRLANKFNKITSFDIYPHRVELITAYKTRMGISNIEEKVKDASVFDESLVESFSAVLCDAPCSGLGVVNDNPDIKLNRELSSVLELTNTQFNILNTVKNYVKKGGYLYYSTCSILKRENDEIIKKFIENNKEFSVCDITSKIECKKTEYGLQFLPHLSGGNGFYVSKLKRGE